jgi:hypothetical protein
VLQKIANLERTEAVEDRPNQENVKLDLRVTGMGFEIDQVSENGLLSKVTQSLEKQRDLGGGPNSHGCLLFVAQNA